MFENKLDHQDLLLLLLLFVYLSHEWIKDLNGKTQMKIFIKIDDCCCCCCSCHTCLFVCSFVSSFNLVVLIITILLFIYLFLPFHSEIQANKLFTDPKKNQIKIFKKKFINSKYVLKKTIHLRPGPWIVHNIVYMENLYYHTFHSKKRWIKNG